MLCKVCILSGVIWTFTFSVSVFSQDGPLTLPGAAQPENTVTISDPIKAKPEALSDFDLTRRITSIFSEIESLEGIGVTVRNSVVTLTGKAISQAAISRAESLASQVEGVAEVVTEVNLSTDISVRLNATFSKILQTVTNLVASLPLLILAVTVTAGFWFMGRYIAAQQSWFRHVAPNHFIAHIIGNITWTAITILGLFVGLSLLDATHIIGTVLGAAGIVGLAVGFAVRDTVENFIASILLSLRRPFSQRDFVNIEGIEGRVARLTSRAPILISSQGNHVRVPNSKVYKSTIINYTRNPARLFQFTVGVDTETDLLDVQKMAKDTLLSIDGILEEPAPLALLQEIGDSNVVIRIKGWVDQSSHDIEKIKSESIRQIIKSFERNNVGVPEPIYRLRVSNADTLPMSTPPASPSGGVQRPARASQGEDAATLQTLASDDAESVLIDEIADTEAENLLLEDSPQE